MNASISYLKSTTESNDESSTVVLSTELDYSYDVCNNSNKDKTFNAPRFSKSSTDSAVLSSNQSPNSSSTKSASNITSYHTKSCNSENDGGAGFPEFRTRRRTEIASSPDPPLTASTFCNLCDLDDSTASGTTISLYELTDNSIPALVDHYAQEENDTTVHTNSRIPISLQHTDASDTNSTPNRGKVTGIAEYIQDEESGNPACTPLSPTQRKRNPPKRKQITKPWYCESRPIREQTKNIKITSVNRSSSINISRLLNKCRSMLEFCTVDDDHRELDDNTLPQLNHNYNWGDSLPSNTKGSSIRVVYQNVHRSLSASDNPHTNQLLDNLHRMEADIFMASETNVNWKSPSNRAEYKKKVSKLWPSNRIAFSSSDVGLQFELHEFLPGGSCTMAVDHMGMRVVKAGEDGSGLGRWSYLTVEGQSGRKITFITAYRICKGTLKGTSTSCVQQQRILEAQAMKSGESITSIDTNFLRRKFVDDILFFINSLKEAGHAIVLGLDANETQQEAVANNVSKEGSIAWLLEQAELVDVFQSRHDELPDSSTTTPGRYIDRVAVYGIPIERVAILRAHEPAKSDHLGIVVDLDLRYIFTNACSPLVHPTPRKLTSGNKQAVQKYIAFVQKQFTEHKIADRIRRLQEAHNNDEFSDSHRQQLFSLDTQVTEILLGAENQCSKRKVARNLWSPALRKAGREVVYWKRRMSSNGHLDEGTKDLGLELQLPATIQQPLTLPLGQFYLQIAWKTYRGIKAQARELRERFLKARAEEHAAKGNGDVAKAIKAIRHRERLKQDYKSIQLGYGKQKLGLSTLDTPDEVNGGRRLLTDAKEIHQYLLRRNAKHYSQATYTTFGDAGPGYHYIDPDNPESDSHIDSMLDGTFAPWESASPAVCEFLRELECTVKTEISTKLHLGDFIQLFKSIPEATASSVSGLHYGHYRVLSQMEDESLIRVLFDIMNLAFHTNSPLPRWKHATQLMLEKGKGPGIENLRIIQLLEADMNWLLRFLWGRQLEKHAVQAGAYHEGQFASPGKLCQSAILNKVLFFDQLRQTRQYGALMDNDATAAFDRVLPALCVVTCRQLGMPKEAQRFFLKLLRQMEFTVTTAHGKSVTTYAAMDDPKAPGQGVIQGGGASLPNYKSQQHPVLKAYVTNCTPALFRHASTIKKQFRRWASGFSDDISLLLNEFGVQEAGLDPSLPMAIRVKNALQRNLQKYEEYFSTAGGALNIKKCFYYLVGFTWTGTAWRYQENSELSLDPVTVTPTTLDNSGSPQQVTWHEAHDAQRTLGAFLAPDGSIAKQMDILHGHLKAWQMCLQNIKSTNLSAKWLSYKTVFMKKVLYPLIGHSCDESDLHFIQQPVDREVLHLLGCNEHLPRAVLHAPMLYGGMGCSPIHAQHVAEKLLLFLHHIREGGQIKECLMASISTTQIECGTSTPFFSLPAAKWYPLVTKTWVTHLWKECSSHGIDIRFHTDSFWVPKPVRENDQCIMQIAGQMYDGQQLYQINMCRIALQVTFLSDITTVDGRRILLAYYNGKAHKDSGRRTCINWPPVGSLPQRWWEQWQEFLTRWCGTGLQLPVSLGGWYDGIEHLTLCCFFMHENRLIMQQQDGFYEFLPVTPRATTRFNPQAVPFRDLGLLEQAYVVDVTFKSALIYVIAKSSQNILKTPSNPQRRGPHGLYRSIPPEVLRLIGSVQWPSNHALIDIVDSLQEGTLVGASDGSVRAREGKASHAWIIQAPNGSEITGWGPVDGPSRARTSHRAELQGQTALYLILSLIAQYFRIVGGNILTFCDNKAVVCKLQKGWRQWRYRHTKGADGDLQTLIRSTLNDLETTMNVSYTTEWIQSHQDDQSEVKHLPRPAQLNIRMDNDTKKAYQLPAQWQTQSFVPVFRSERCALYVGQQKITSHVQLSVLETWHEKEAREYFLKRHGIDSATFDTVNWRALRYALGKLSAHRRATAVKAIHRHLPTQEKLFNQNRVAMTSLCPRCLCAAETNSHVYCCPHTNALKQRKCDWLDLWKHLHRCKTAPIIEQTWRSFLQPIIGLPLGESIVDTIPITHGEVTDLLQQAVKEQTAIGWEKLLLGMGTVAWQQIQDIFDSGNPHPPKRDASDWMNTAARHFLKFSLRCWKGRNQAIHGSTKSEQQEIALQQARDRITEIYQNPPDLAPHYRSIFEVPLEHRLKMPLQAAEHWLSLIAHRIKVTKHNIATLVRQHRPMKSHLRTMRCIARRQAKDRALPSTPKKARSREVQAAVKLMRTKLYNTKRASQRCQRRSQHHSYRQFQQSRLSSHNGGQINPNKHPCPPLRIHPP